MATRTGRGRPCTYCPRTGADVCVRVLRDDHGGQHIYAHRACAEDRSVTPMYSFIDQPKAGAGR
ncbi:hypothetical protein ACFU51_05055 [Streptomyces sp. NPDC057430]|uniref:hypothetical protein n=1 Tax=Streptomyces sp. NPDC057430 TaxID=3346131 RepID=UPI0036CFE8A5